MPRALISVYDKTGIIEFAKELAALGWDIVSSGGTHKALQDAGIKALLVEEITDFPEMMDGRVKTLHPKIHAGILADRNVPEHMDDAKQHGIAMVDMVVMNLYPFAEVIKKPNVTEEEAIHNIDIGGPAMMRAAAKNYQYVTVVIDPKDYDLVLKELHEGGTNLETRKALSVKAFRTMAQYNRIIANYFSASQDLELTYAKVGNLRYGENPHQKAALYKDREIRETTVVEAEVLHGKELSYNNIMDADAALNLIKEFSEPASAVIKHTNPCGCAVAPNINDAFKRAYEADSKSAFGGIIAINKNCTKDIAEYINNVFVEVVLAPDFEDEALRILKQKKNIRLLKLGKFKKQDKQKHYRQVIGGILEQDLDRREIKKSNLNIVSKRKPTEAEIDDMLFAWKVVKHVKSNAIVLVKNGETVGIGAGQMSRVDSVDIAIKKAGSRAKGSICASDAFFPFKDNVEALAGAGVIAVIQPGGSVKDEEVIQAVDELELSMAFTGVRAFKH